MSIDYGRLTQANRNPKTCIHFGCISLNSLDPDLCNDFYSLPNPSLDSAFAAYCRDQLQELADKGEITADDLDLDDPTMDLSDAIADLPDDDARAMLEACDLRAAESFWDGCDSTLDGAKGEIDGVTVSIFDLGGALNLMILDSPHTGHFAFCSPCIPGAGDLDSPDPSGPLTYDVPPDWRATESE